MTHETRPLSEWLTFRNGSTSPSRYEGGRYSVFGSNGEIGRSDETNVTGPHVVIGRVGSYCGSLHFSPGSSWVTENAIVCLARDPLEARFWFYALATQNLNERRSGSGQPLLNQRTLYGIEFEAPEPSRRRAIAEVLGTLDDKIAANQVVIALADQLRRVRYEAMLGARAEPLSDLARFVNGRAYTNGATGTGRVVIRIAELNSGLGGSTVYNDIEVPNDNLARPGDLLFAWSGSLTAARWYRSEAIVNQHIFKVIPKGGWPMWAVATAIHRKLDDFKGIAADKATTMGHIQRHHLDQLVSVPIKEQIVKHDAAMNTLWDRALAAEIESLELATLRDTLLPNLMSGRITVREAEVRLEESL